MEFLCLFNAYSISFIHMVMFMKDLLYVQHREYMDSFMQNSCVSYVTSFFSVRNACTHT